MSGARWYRALHWILQILQISKRNIIFQIIPRQVCVNDPVSLGYGLFMPHFLIYAGGSSDDRICFFLTAFGLALNLGDRGNLISWPTSHIGMGHTFFSINITSELVSHDGVVEAVESGRIPESRIDESVRRILETKRQLGLLEG